MMSRTAQPPCSIAREGLAGHAVLILHNAISTLSRRDRQTAARITALRRRGLWPPIVPTAVLVESLTGNGARDALANRVVGLSLVHPLDDSLARRAAQLRSKARVGSAVDARGGAAGAGCDLGAELRVAHRVFPA